MDKDTLDKTVDELALELRETLLGLCEKRAKVILQKTLRDLGYSGNALMLDEEYMKEEARSHFINFFGCYYTSSKGIPSLEFLTQGVYAEVLDRLYRRMSRPEAEQPQSTKSLYDKFMEDRPIIHDGFIKTKNRGHKK